jgi:hypothetical protein
MSDSDVYLKEGDCILMIFIVQWVVKGAVDVDIGANPSAEGGEEDEGVNDEAVKVVDIVDTFRLQVISHSKFGNRVYFNIISRISYVV